MRRQQAEVVDAVVVEGDPVDVHDEGLVVDHVDRGDAAVELGVADAALRMAADLVGEQHVVGGHRRAVAPGGVGLDRVGERDAVAAVVLLLDHRLAVLERRQLGAEHADQLPVGVVGGERPLRHAEDVALGRHGIDVRVEGRGELGDPDHQLIPGGARAARQAEGERQQQDREQAAHGRSPRWLGGVGRDGGLHRARPARMPGASRIFEHASVKGRTGGLPGEARGRAGRHQARPGWCQRGQAAARGRDLGWWTSSRRLGRRSGHFRLIAARGGRPRPQPFDRLQVLDQLSRHLEIRRWGGDPNGSARAHGRFDDEQRCDQSTDFGQPDWPGTGVLAAQVSQRCGGHRRRRDRGARRAQHLTRRRPCR